MSLSQLKSELIVRTGQNLMPENLPIDSLIFLARKLQFYVNDSLSDEEMYEFFGFFLFYIKKIMQTESRRDYGQLNINNTELFGLLVCDLEDAIHDALISRLIGVAYNPISVDKIFIKNLNDNNMLPRKNIQEIN